MQEGLNVFLDCILIIYVFLLRHIAFSLDKCLKLFATKLFLFPFEVKKCKMINTCNAFLDYLVMKKPVSPDILNVWIFTSIIVKNLM